MITIATEIEGISTRKDKTLKIVFSTQELSPSQSGDLFSLQGKVAYLAIKTEKFQKSEVEFLSKAETDVDLGKSPSERMRNVLFILWKQENEGYTEFNDFYRKKMEGFIDKLKSRIV
jgi:hypothetical protein